MSRLRMRRAWTWRDEQKLHSSQLWKPLFACGHWKKKQKTKNEKKEKKKVLIKKKKQKIQKRKYHKKDAPAQCTAQLYFSAVLFTSNYWRHNNGQAPSASASSADQSSANLCVSRSSNGEAISKIQTYILRVRRRRSHIWPLTNLQFLQRIHPKPPPPPHQRTNLKKKPPFNYYFSLFNSHIYHRLPVLMTTKIRPNVHYLQRSTSQVSQTG